MIDLYNNFPEKAWAESDGGQGVVSISKYFKLEPPTAKSKTQDCISQVTRYFTLSKEARIPTLEDYFCPSALELIKCGFTRENIVFCSNKSLSRQNMVPYTIACNYTCLCSNKTLSRQDMVPYTGPGEELESTMLSISEGKVENMQQYHTVQ